MKNPENLYEYIDQIKERPGMYLGTASITALQHHIYGYQAACRFKGIAENLSPDFHDFHEFVRTYYHHEYNNGRSWENILLEEHHNDQAEALKNFFRLFDLFRKKES